MIQGPNYCDPDSDKRIDKTSQRAPLNNDVPLFDSLEDFFAFVGWDAATQARVRAEMLLTGIIADTRPKD